ncbi:hypothetical protein, partial [Deinococcus saxicola]|uniref:hypothetical protein n=1 Tax=Deinococcus saxicola TaxID=249406 RepID=UPI003D11E4E8
FWGIRMRQVVRKLKSLIFLSVCSSAFAQGSPPPATILEIQTILVADSFREGLKGFYQGPTKFYESGGLKGDWRLDACKIWLPLINEAQAKQKTFESTIVYVNAALERKIAIYSNYVKFVIADQALQDAAAATNDLNGIMCGLSS